MLTTDTITLFSHPVSPSSSPQPFAKCSTAPHQSQAILLVPSKYFAAFSPLLLETIPIWNVKRSKCGYIHTYDPCPPNSFNDERLHLVSFFRIVPIWRNIASKCLRCVRCTAQQPKSVAHFETKMRFCVIFIPWYSKERRNWRIYGEKKHKSKTEMESASSICPLRHRIAATAVIIPIFVEFYAAIYYR